MRRIAILGSTGSIGRSTLRVVESYPERFQVITLAAGRNLDEAFEQARRWRPQILSVAGEKDADALKARLKSAGVRDIEVVYGPAGNVRCATHRDVDFVVSAIVGVAGLEATYEAVCAGKIIGLANKECMVAAGELITAEARRQAKPLLPIDSEHNAVHQCLAPERCCQAAAHHCATRRFVFSQGGVRSGPKSKYGRAHRDKFRRPIPIPFQNRNVVVES